MRMTISFSETNVTGKYSIKMHTNYTEQCSSLQEAFVYENYVFFSCVVDDVKIQSKSSEQVKETDATRIKKA
jgi:hypothetical protein